LIGTQVFTVIFARDIFLAGPEGVGGLRTTIALGAVTGGFVLGTGRFAKRPVVPMVLGYMIEGLGLVGLALSPTLVIALFVMFFLGIGNVLAEVNRNTIVQLKTPDEVRGRVSALAQVATFGGPLLGQLQAGALVGALGPITACACDGLAIAVGAVFFGLLHPLRRAAREGID
jgi:MFS family permease